MTCQFETPIFVYYSYISVIILSLITGFLILSKDKKHLINRNAFYFILVISFWILADFLRKIVPSLSLNLFIGRMETLVGFAALFFLFFSYHFTRTPISFKKKVLLSLPFLVLIPLVSTDFNLRIFNAENCKFVDGPLVFYVYGIIIIYTGMALLNLFRKLNDPITPYQMKSQLRILISSAAFFAVWNIVNEEVSRISTLGNNSIEIAPYFVVGNLFFVSMIAFSIIKKNLFEFRNVLTIGFTLFIWTGIFFLLIFFSANPQMTIISIVAYVALLIIFWKM